jgi:hypothetical protein
MFHDNVYRAVRITRNSVATITRPRHNFSRSRWLLTPRHNFPRSRRLLAPRYPPDPKSARSRSRKCETAFDYDRIYNWLLTGPHAINTRCLWANEARVYERDGQFREWQRSRPHAIPFARDSHANTRRDLSWPRDNRKQAERRRRGKDCVPLCVMYVWVHGCAQLII